MAGEESRSFGLEVVSLQNAMLCIDCESITASAHDSCPVCGGHSLLGLAKILGGTLATHRASRPEPGPNKYSGLSKPLDADISINLDLVSPVEFSEILRAISSALGPTLEHERSSLHIDAQPHPRKRRAASERRKIA